MSNSQLGSSDYYPLWEGSTGGFLESACDEEYYVITWQSANEQIFELPTSGAGMMRKGKTLAAFPKKEQCLALAHQLRRRFKIDDIRIFLCSPQSARGSSAPDSISVIHPRDGEVPEKKNPGRSPCGVMFDPDLYSGTP